MGAEPDGDCDADAVAFGGVGEVGGVPDCDGAAEGEGDVVTVDGGGVVPDGDVLCVAVGGEAAELGDGLEPV